MTDRGSYEVAIVSCDIIGHSAVRDHRLQMSRVAAINEIMARTITGQDPGVAIWASGGDGGHLVLKGDGWHDAALDLITSLRAWAALESVRLRVTAHVGQVSDLVGADGRTQIVGDGINVAGWLLTRGAAAGVVVSRSFRDAVLATADRPALSFHDERSLRDKSGTDQRLFLMSTVDDASGWDLPTESDRRTLAASVERGDGWEILHQAKRIMQINQADYEADRSLRQLKLSQLTRNLPDGSGVSHQFLERLGMVALREVVKVGQLVERRYNEYICRHGDHGDTMFLILRGQVGVYLPAQEAAAEAPARPSFVLGEGEMVGELAFALSRTRTADLVALTDTTLLAFSYQDIETRLGPEQLNRVDDFMTSRALEHVSQHVPFLLGPEKDGPLAAGEEGWEDSLAVLAEHCELIPIPNGRSRLDFAGVTAESRSAQDGVYVLVSGELHPLGPDDPGHRRHPVRKLSAEDFPVLWIQVPHVAVLPRRTFWVDLEPIKILYIDSRGLARLRPRARSAAYAAIRLAARTCFEYDAFISYNSEDLDAAIRWSTALEKAGLRVFRDEPRRGAAFPPRLWSAIRQARALVPLISPHVMVRDDGDNWVRREVEAHKHYFDECRIYPVILPGGRHESIVSGFRPVEITSDEPAAIEELVHELIALRDGSQEPPIASSVRSDNPPGT